MINTQKNTQQEQLQSTIKILLIISMVVFMGMANVNASLGCFKQNENFDIITNSNSSSVNISEIQSPPPNSSLEVRNVAMTKVGNSFNYTFSGSKLGEYKYGYCDFEGNCYSNDFTITPNGKCGSGANIVFFVIVIILIYAIAFIGLFGKNIPMTIMGGMAMLFLGIYLFNNGIIIFRDDLTRYLSYVTIGIGAILAVWASYEWYQDM